MLTRPGPQGPRSAAALLETRAAARTCPQAEACGPLDTHQAPGSARDAAGAATHTATCSVSGSLR